MRRCLWEGIRSVTLREHRGRAVRANVGHRSSNTPPADPVERLSTHVSVAFTQPPIGYRQSEAAVEPPIHWPSAIVGLLLAIMLIVSVSWLASGPGVDRRPTTASSEARPVEPSTIAAAAVQQAAADPPVVAPATPAEQVKVTATRGAGVNLRNAAGERAARLKTLPEGTLLQVIGPDTQTDGIVWRNVREPSGGVGWVAASFLASAPRAP